MVQLQFPLCPVCGTWTGDGNRTVNKKYCTPKCGKTARDLTPAKMRQKRGLNDRQGHAENSLYRQLGLAAQRKNQGLG